MRILQLVLFLIFLVAVLIFGYFNREPIVVKYPGGSLPGVPLYLMTVGVYLLGMLSGWTVVAFVRRSLQRVTELPKDRS